MIGKRPLQSKVDRLTFLAEASLHLAESADYEDALDTIAALSLPRRGDWSIIDLVAADGSIRRLSVVHPDPEMQVLARRLQLGWPPNRDDPLGVPVVLRTRCAEVINPVTEAMVERLARDDEHLEILRKLAIGSVMTVPLVAQERVFGAMTFISGTPGERHGDDDLALAEDLAARCALAIQQTLLVQDLRKSVLLRDHVLGYVSHDLKNPLNSIMLSASSILAEARSAQMEPSPERWVGMAETIMTSGKHMQRLIGDLLSVAQIGEGGVTIARQLLDPYALLEDVRRTYAMSIEARSLRFANTATEDLPLFWADPGRVRQVFENLLENAAKFTPAGGSISLGAARLHDSVLFSVTDNGAGIPREDLPCLFDRFWQGRRSGPSSAGLGLAISKGIVEAHGGAMWVESEVGRGSTFYFRIPVGDDGHRLAGVDPRSQPGV